CCRAVVLSCRRAVVHRAGFAAACRAPAVYSRPFLPGGRAPVVAPVVATPCSIIIAYIAKCYCPIG
ncbi:hypothetical protein, partial [Burkholderia sp. Nafp2/4-1b]|uniref:hypothetical protein n=1 Tax=Burkholderia sp. Nafp2/4-1b TaxID=2116686 RepID=UPI00196A120A